MLSKDPEKRIDMIHIYEHPWMVKYRLKEERWSDEEQSSSTSSSRQSAESLDGAAPQENEDPEAQDVNGHDDQESNGSGSPVGHVDGDHAKNVVKRIHENNFLQNQFLFNIHENEDETTGNFVRVDLKRTRKDSHMKGKAGGTYYGNQPQVPEERRAGSKNSRKSNQSVRRHLSLRNTGKPVGGQVANPTSGNANNAGSGIGYGSSGQAGEPSGGASGSIRIQRQSAGVDGQALQGAYGNLNSSQNMKNRNNEYQNQQGTSSAAGKQSNGRVRVSKRQSGNQFLEFDQAAQQHIGGELLTPKKHSIDRMNSQNDAALVGGLRSTNPSPRATATMGSNNDVSQLNGPKKQNTVVKKKRSKIKQASYGPDVDMDSGLVPGHLKPGHRVVARKHMGQSKKSSSIYFNDPQFERSIIKGPTVAHARQTLKQQERLLKQSYIIDGPRESQVEQRHRVSSQALKPNGLSPGGAIAVPPANYDHVAQRSILPTKDSVGSAQLSKRHTTKPPKRIAGPVGEFKSPDVNARRQLETMLSGPQVQGERRMAQSFYREGQSDGTQLRLPFEVAEGEHQSLETPFSKASRDHAQLRSTASKDYKFRQSDVANPSSLNLNSRTAAKVYQNPKDYFGNCLFESQSPKNMAKDDREGVGRQQHQSSHHFAAGTAYGQRKPPPESAHANIQERSSVGFIAKNGGGLNQARLAQVSAVGKKLAGAQASTTDAHILATDGSQNQLQSLMGDRGGAGASRQLQQQQSLAGSGTAARSQFTAQGGTVIVGVRRESMNTSQKMGINPNIQRIPRRDISFFKGNKPNNTQLDFSQSVVTGFSIEGSRNSTAGANGYVGGKLGSVPDAGAPDTGISGATTAAATAKATLERSKTHENIKRNLAQSGAASTNQKVSPPQHHQANARNAIRFDDQINQQHNQINSGQMQSPPLVTEHQIRGASSYTTAGGVKPPYHQYMNPETQAQLPTKKRTNPYGNSAERNHESDQNQPSSIKLPDIKKTQVINEAPPGYGVGSAQAARTQTQIVAPTMNLQLYQQNLTTPEKPSASAMQPPAATASASNPPNLSLRQIKSQVVGGNAPSRQGN